MKIATLKSDFCVKEIFENEVVRRYFISDVLQIPIEDIHSVRLLNTSLRKKFQNQKLGILDILLELNNSVKINIELQIKTKKNWDQRQLFYLSKLYVSDLRAGQNFSKLKRCVAISILDFNLTDREEYHSVYKLRDENGNKFSDMFEIHTLELQKKLTGNAPLDDWVRLFNAESMEDLDMIKTENLGIREAIRELKNFSLTGEIRYYFEQREKARRDKQAEDEYIFDQGMEKGIEAFLTACHELGLPREAVFDIFKEKFRFPDDEAKAYFNKFWDESNQD